MAYLKIFSALLLLVSVGILEAQEAPIATHSVKRIVILGDSITAGHGLDPKEAYPAILQNKVDDAELPYKVINAGVSGDTTAGGLRRIAWAMAKGADVLVIALGGNDGLRGISPEETKKNLLGIVEKARTKNPKAKILVAGMQMPDNLGADYTQKYREVFPRVAKETQATLIPFLLEGVGGSLELNQADRIHPTAEGQKRVATNVWAKLQGVLES